MDLKEIGINEGNLVDSAQDKDYLRAIINAALNLRVPKVKESVTSSLILIDDTDIKHKI